VIIREPFSGLGKPEALKFKWSGWWSRRITEKHWLVYKIVADEVRIAECLYHY
jgi:toxin YoeB